MASRKRALIFLILHSALSVTDLNAWMLKLRSEAARLLSAGYPLGENRAMMVKGPSRDNWSWCKYDDPTINKFSPAPQLGDCKWLTTC